MAGVDREQVIDAAEGDGDERDLGADGEESSTGEKCLHSAGWGAGAFRKNEEGHASAESADGCAEARKRRMRVDGINGELAGTVEMPTDEWDGPQLLFGEDAELERKRGEDDRCVHVGRVVGGVDGDGVLVEVFRATHGETRAGEEDATAGPDAGNAVLGATGLLEVGQEKRKGAATAGPKKKERNLNEIGLPAIEPGQRIGRTGHAGTPVRARRRARASPTR